MVPRVPKALFCWVLVLVVVLGTVLRTMPLEQGGTPGTSATLQAPARFLVRLETTKGSIVVECFRSWAPHGADRFYELVTSGYYDDAAIFRIRPKTWAQFGIAGSTQGRAGVAHADHSRRSLPAAQPNVRGTVAFAWAVPNGRTTQVFINLRDNRETHDKEPFVPFGRVIEGMEIADAWFDEYGETAGGGIRAGKQDPVFQGGNDYLRKNFPKLDYIKSARILP